MLRAWWDSLERDRYRRDLKGDLMDYEVISTGSHGNCVIINDVMIDCGIAFKDIEEHLYNVKYLLLTHNHSDHIKKATLRKIKSKFPRVQIIGNYEVHQVHKVDTVSNHGYPVETKDYTFIPFECVHDVVTQGFTWKYKDYEIIYATDTSSLENAPIKKYDYLFLESNHDEKKLEKVIGERKGSYSPYLSSKRHLSTKACRTFYYLNRRNRDSKLIELHMSKRFY